MRPLRQNALVSVVIGSSVLPTSAAAHKRSNRSKPGLAAKAPTVPAPSPRPETVNTEVLASLSAGVPAAVLHRAELEMLRGNRAVVFDEFCCARFQVHRVMDPDRVALGVLVRERHLAGGDEETRLFGTGSLDLDEMTDPLRQMTRR